MRKIITYSTLGDNMKEVFSNARNLEELMPDLAQAGVRFEGMKLMTNPGQQTLESLQAELPQGEFQLFIMPQKVKSGYSDEELTAEYYDDEDTIGWEDEDWSEEDPDSGNFVFKSAKDLAIARAKRAFALLEKSVQYLTGHNNKSTSKISAPVPSDPILASLRESAEKLQRNMEIFG